MRAWIVQDLPRHASEVNFEFGVFHDSLFEDGKRGFGRFQFVFRLRAAKRDDHRQREEKRQRTSQRDNPSLLCLRFGSKLGDFVLLFGNDGFRVHTFWGLSEFRQVASRMIPAALLISQCWPQPLAPLSILGRRNSVQLLPLNHRFREKSPLSDSSCRRY